VSLVELLFNESLSLRIGAAELVQSGRLLLAAQEQARKALVWTTIPGQHREIIATHAILMLIRSNMTCISLDLQISQVT
jgi:hypothetical protein